MSVLWPILLKLRIEVQYFIYSINKNCLNNFYKILKDFINNININNK